jgi:hypothetical protein
MKGEFALGALAVVGIVVLELDAIQHGIDGVALSASVGAIAAIVSAVATKRWYQRYAKK